MRPDQKARMAEWVAKTRRMEHLVNLEGGFHDLPRGVTGKWHDFVHPWPGELRLIPAINATGMLRWRHATALELTDWVLDGCQGWGDDHPPVLALGSIYDGRQAPVAKLSVRPGGQVRLLTMAAGGQTKPNAILRAFLRALPHAKALCVVPRN